MIKAYWHKSENYGDQISQYLLEMMSGEQAQYTYLGGEPVYMVTGSILDQAVSSGIVWGNGYARADAEVRKPKEIHAVRGPLTRQKLVDAGHECPEVYGDPGLLLPRIYNPPTPKKWSLGIIPHMIDEDEVISKYRDNLDGMTTIISLRNKLSTNKEVEVTTRQIMECEMTVSSSLHGLVVSHAYGIPSMWVEFSDKILGDGFKYKDYLLSVGMEPYEPLDLRTPMTPKEIRKRIPRDKIDIDLDTLWDVCPFRKRDASKKDS